MVDARVMRLASTILLILTTCLLLTGATRTHNDEEQKILSANSVITLDRSVASKDDFAQFLDNLCLTDMSYADHLKTYIAWENVEFLNAAKKFLNPGKPDQKFEKYFDHLGHLYETNCTKKDDKLIRDTHDAITSDTLFDNFMYDMMTKKHITSVNL